MDHCRTHIPLCHFGPSPRLKDPHQSGTNRIPKRADLRGFVKPQAGKMRSIPVAVTNATVKAMPAAPPRVRWLVALLLSTMATIEVASLRHLTVTYDEPRHFL